MEVSLPTTKIRRQKPAGWWFSRIGFYGAVVLIIMVFTAPFLWLIINSLKTPDTLFKRSPDLVPSPPTLQNYSDVLFSGRSFVGNIINSCIAASFTTLGCILVGTLAGYALGRIEFRGRGILLTIVLMVTMFPGIAVIGPLYLLFSNLELINKLQVLFLPYITFNLPLTVWLLAAFFRDMPKELEEAAEVDGAHPFGAFWRVMLPLAVPGIVTAGLLIFINAWNDFLFARTFLSTDANYTAPVAIATFQGIGEGSEPWGQISAGAVLVTTPLVILVLLFQRRIISGLTSGAVKG